MRKSRLQPLATFRVRTRLLRVVEGSSVLGDADKQLALAGQKLKLPGDGLALSPFFTQHENKQSNLSGYLPLC